MDDTVKMEQEQQLQPKQEPKFVKTAEIEYEQDQQLQFELEKAAMLLQQHGKPMSDCVKAECDEIGADCALPWVGWSDRVKAEPPDLSLQPATSGTVYTAATDHCQHRPPLIVKAECEQLNGATTTSPSVASSASAGKTAAATGIAAVQQQQQQQQQHPALSSSSSSSSNSASVLCPTPAHTKRTLPSNACAVQAIDGKARRVNDRLAVRQVAQLCYSQAAQMKDCVDMLRDMSHVMQFQSRRTSELQQHQGLHHNPTQLADSEQQLNVIATSSAALATQVSATLRSLKPFIDTGKLVVDQRQSDQTF